MICRLYPEPDLGILRRFDQGSSQRTPTTFDWTSPMKLAISDQQHLSYMHRIPTRRYRTWVLSAIKDWIQIQGVWYYQFRRLEIAVGDTIIGPRPIWFDLTYYVILFFRLDHALPMMNACMKELGLFVDCLDQM